MMNQKTLIKKDHINKISFLLIFLLVFFNAETFPSINFPGPIKSILVLAGVVFVVFFINLIFKNKKINIRSSIFVLILVSFIVITMVWNLDFTGGYIQIVISIFIGYMLTHIVSTDDFINSYIKILVFLSLYSLIITYLFRPVLFNMPEIIFPRFINSAGVPFIDARFSVVVNIRNYFRNFGIFREPGVYQVFLNFALIFELFFKKTKVNLINLSILYITILSTFSTPGYITGAIITICFILSKRKGNFVESRKAKKRLLVFIALLFSFTVLAYFTNNNFGSMVDETVNKLLMKESSYSGRSVAIMANISAWLNSPIFGNGINKGLLNIAYELMANNSIYSTTHNTSTVGALLNVFGLLFTAIYSYFIYKLLSISQCKKKYRILLFLAVMISINTQLLIYNELLYTMVFFGIQVYVNEKK